MTRQEVRVNCHDRVGIMATMTPSMLEGVHPQASPEYVETTHPPNANLVMFLESLLPTIRHAAAYCLRGWPRSAWIPEMDDLCQEVAVHLLEDDCRRLRSYDPARSSPRTWLCAVARSLVAQHLRSSGCGVVRPRATSVPPPDEILMRAEEEAAFEAARSRLDEQDRAFLDVLDRYEFRLELVSYHLGMPRRQIYERKRRLVENLRRCARASVESPRG
jgi:RNA polymerase sigma factor (sigma-70 family)